MKRIGLQLTNSASSSASDLVLVTLWDGTTKVGTGLFTGTNTLATTTFTSTFTVPKDGDKILTIKGDLGSVGTNKAGTQGALIGVDYDGDRTFATAATGQSSGTEVTSNSASDTDASGVRMFQSYPTIAKVALPTNTLANGERSLLRFKVTADASAAGRGIQIYKFTINLATTTAIAASLNIYAYTDSGFSTPVSGLSSDGGMEDAVIDLGALWASSSSDLNVYAKTAAGASTTVQIPSGGTRYFEVRATITGAIAGASISTQLQGDAAYPAIQSLMSSTTAATADSAIDGGLAGNDDLLWSPNATTTADLDSDDWTNGFGVVGLPSSNMTAEILSL